MLFSQHYLYAILVNFAADLFLLYVPCSLVKERDVIDGHRKFSSFEISYDWQTDVDDRSS